MDLIETLVTSGVTLAAVWLGSSLTHGVSRREKLTDLRRNAYGAILAELTDVETRLEWIEETIAMHGEARYFNSTGEDAKVRERNDAYLSEHMVAVRKHFVDNYLVLSAAFVKRYEQMTSELAEGSDEAPPDEHESFDKAVRKARPDFLAIAMREVGPEEGSLWHRIWKTLGGSKRR